MDKITQNISVSIQLFNVGIINDVLCCLGFAFGNNIMYQVYILLFTVLTFLYVCKVNINNKINLYKVLFAVRETLVECF